LYIDYFGGKIMARGNSMAFSQEAGMVYDAKRKSAYGSFNGYQVVIQEQK
jgi:hypothetical protein